MTEEQMKELTRDNVEANLGDAVAEDGPDAIYDSAYVLAFDKLADAGVDHARARAIAGEVARSFVQP